MNGMTIQERIDDICKYSGISEDIVRRVLDAERKSVVESLRRGERANLIGRVVIRPEIRHKVSVGDTPGEYGKPKPYIKLHLSAAAALTGMLDDLGEFEGEKEPDISNDDALKIINRQISALM